MKSEKNMRKYLYSNKTLDKWNKLSEKLACVETIMNYKLQ